MPTKRQASAAAAAPAAALPLQDLTLTLSGKFESYGYSQGSYQDLVRKLGGKIAASVTKACTHVVATEEEYLNNGNKVAAGFAGSRFVVDPSWVIDCEAEGKKVDEANYEHSGTQIGGANPNPNPRGVKRSASTVSSQVADTKKAKGTKKDTKFNGTNGTNGSQANGDSAKNDVKKEDKEEKQVAEGQFMKQKGTTVPVDEYCPLSTWQVYVEPDTGMIWDASLNQSNSGRNNNKFYRVQILYNASGSYKTWTRWGRVGEAGQNALLGGGSLPDAIKQFEKKFRDKSGLAWANRGDDPKPNKYAFVERSYNDDSSDDEANSETDGVKKEEGEDDDAVIESKLDQPTQGLMALIFNQQYFLQTMSALNYDANKLPLGKLSKATITRGFQQLKDLSNLMNDSSLAQSRWDMTVGAATEHLSNTYYSLIPHAFGRNRPPVISEFNLLKKEIELLESLSDMKDAAEIMKIDKKVKDTLHPLDRQFQGLNLNEMTTLDSSSTEFNTLSDYLINFTGATHHVSYSVEQIFRIERQGETSRFDASPYASMPSDRRLLWHGSRATNFGGILSQGLRIAPPEAPSTGYMFGKGIYLADMSSKSANYCCSYNTGGTALLLLCEAELGDPMQKLTDASYLAGDTAKEKGCISTWGVGETGPEKWMDAGVVHESLKGIKMPDTSAKATNSGDYMGLMYNEYICYDVAQVKLRYLLRVKM